MIHRRDMLITSALLLTAAFIQPAAAQKQYGPGVTDTEIKIGQTMPYSGPASAYGTLGLIEDAYYAMVNSKGGVNGRKIKLISLDDDMSWSSSRSRSVGTSTRLLPTSLESV